MIFLTVGTEYPFDRLVRPIDEYVGCGKLREEVFAQIGIGGYRPKHLFWKEFLTPEEFDIHLAKCRAVVSHAGMGTILRCIEYRKPLLVMPRLKAYSEIVSDHQVPTANCFAERGDILLANDEDQLEQRLSELARFSPPKSEIRPQHVVDHIERFLRAIELET